MSETLDLLLTVGPIIAGILLLTGHGSFLMGGGEVQKRQRMYDEKKMEKACGIAMLVIGIATGIESYLVSSVTAEIIYIVFVFVVFAVMIYYMKTKCKK